MSTDSISPEQRVTLFLSALQHVDDVIDTVPAERWANTSPCDGWTAEHVLRHITGTLSKVHDMLDQGGAYGAVPAPASGATGTDAVSEWQTATLRVTQALGEADLTARVQTAGGEMHASDALGLPTADLVVHSWDIAAATGVDRELPADLLEAARQRVAQIPEVALRRPGLFAPAVEAAPGASETDVFMAFLGRRLQPV